jgi:hypothetical protein
MGTVEKGGNVLETLNGCESGGYKEQKAGCKVVGRVTV